MCTFFDTKKTDFDFYIANLKIVLILNLSTIFVVNNKKNDI